MSGVSVQHRPFGSAGRAAAAVALGIVLCAGGAAACSDSSSLSAGRRSENVSRSTFTGVWPFTVDAGVLGCTQPQSVTFAVAGTTYGVNSSALDTGSAPIDPIRGLDASGRGAKKSLRDVVAQGLALCKG